MPIAKRGQSYQATVHHQGARFRETFKTEAEATAWTLEAKSALLKGEAVPSKNGQHVSGAPKTLRELYNKTYDRYWKSSRSPKTARINAEACLRALGEFTSPRAVTEQAVDAMLVVFESEGISDSTINRRISALSKMLTFALDRGYIDRKPKMERRKEPVNRIRYLSEGEEEELIAYYRHIAQPDMADLVVLAVDTGMRQGELLKFTPMHCRNGLIQLPGSMTKSGKPRDIPMTHRVAKIIHQRSEGGTGRIMEGWTKDMVRHYWDSGRRHLGLMTDPQFVFHAMRHTFCSRLVQRGVPIQVVSELAGHSTIQMTMKYAHLCPKNLRVAIEVLNS